MDADRVGVGRLLRAGRGRTRRCDGRAERERGHGGGDERPAPRHGPAVPSQPMRPAVNASASPATSVEVVIHVCARRRRSTDALELRHLRVKVGAERGQR